MEPVRKPRRAVDIEIPADGIGAKLFESLERINRVALGLRHLLSVLILYMAQNDEVLIRRLVKDQGGDSQKGIEPSSRLIHRLGDEVRRELLLKQLLILKRIMVLCKRHGTGIEPAVDYLRDSLHLLSALRAGDGHRVDIWPVKLYVIRTVRRHGL